jgi:hypothetical protein
MLLDSLATVSSSHDTEWDKNEALGCLDPGDVPSWLTVAWAGASLWQTHISISNLNTQFMYFFHYKQFHIELIELILWLILSAKMRFQQNWKWSARYTWKDLWIKMYLTFPGIYFKGHKVSFYSSCSQSLQGLKKSNGLFQLILHLNDTMKLITQWNI